MKARIEQLEALLEERTAQPSSSGLFSYYNFDNWAYQPSYVPPTHPASSTVCGFRFFPPRS
jgi:hypothetical protein